MLDVRGSKASFYVCIYREISGVQFIIYIDDIMMCIVLFDPLLEIPLMHKENI